MIRKPVNHTSLVAVVTPTDRPNSVRNRGVIELFWGVVCFVTLPFDIVTGLGDFVIGLSQICSFFTFFLSTGVSTERLPINTDMKKIG